MYWEFLFLQILFVLITKVIFCLLDQSSTLYFFLPVFPCRCCSEGDPNHVTREYHQGTARDHGTQYYPQRLSQARRKVSSTLWCSLLSPTCKAQRGIDCNDIVHVSWLTPFWLSAEGSTKDHRIQYYTWCLSQTRKMLCTPLSPSPHPLFVCWEPERY